MSRRQFLKTAALLAGTGAAAALSGCKIRFQSSEQTASASEQTFHWRLVTTWAPHFPVMGEGLDLFSNWVGQMSGGRLKIQVYGGGELVPPLEVFDAVSQGIAEMGHCAAYYWSGKVPAAQFFCTVPFGLNAQQMNAWLYSGGGLALWEEIYKPHHLIPFPAGNTGVQMGGWFNREIKSVADFEGLKMRMPGLGGKVISKLGATALLSPGSELYTNLERGVIDATEWIGPYHDYLMGFHKIATHYYYPGWHEPGPALELIVNELAFAQLPPDLQEIVRTAAFRLNLWMLSEFEAKNDEYLQKIRQEKQVRILPFPDDVMTQLRLKSAEVIQELTDRDPASKKVFDSWSAFRRAITDYSHLSESAYFSLISGNSPPIP